MHEGKFELATTITGAGGFVGSNLVGALMNPKLNPYRTRIFAIDRLPGRLEGFIGKESMDVGLTSPTGSHVTYHEWDVTQPMRSDFLAVDAIYHFAGIADPQIYVQDPLRVMDLNLLGLRNILDRIVLWSAHRPRIIYSSTSEVYGKSVDVPFHEEDDVVFGNSDKRRWVYAMTKLVGEHYLKAFADQGIRHTIFRFFNFIGDDVDAPGTGRVITRMVSDAIETGKILVTMPGSQTRCFTHRDDFVVPLVRALTMKKGMSWRDPHKAYDDIPPTMNGGHWNYDYVMNLGSDEETSMLSLASKIANTLDYYGYTHGVEIERIAGVERFGKGYDDTLRRKPDVTRAEQILGWKAERQLDTFLPTVVRSAAERHLQAKSTV